jgi:hypothetical protein
VGSRKYPERAKPNRGDIKKRLAPLEEKLNQVEWGEYRLGDLFEIDDWEYGKNKQYKNISKELTTNSLSVISGITQNNGTNYYTTDDLSNNEIYEKELTISTRGEYSGTVFYHDEKFVLANNILVMKMPNLTKNQKLFIGGLIDSLPYGGYSGYPKKETLKNDFIRLPTKNGQIDFEFMESFVAELEAERVAELEAYLQATGLKDYNLTVKEKQVLTDFENGEFEWSEYKLGDLFEKVYTKKLPFKADELPKKIEGNFNLPCLTSSFKNQGLNYFVPRELATILKNVISIPSNSDVYKAYFQSNEFTVLSDAYAVQWAFNNFKLEPNQYLFIVQCINMVTNLSIYSYKNKLGGWNVVKNKYIQLPTKNSQPDYVTMETLISAIQKLVIKDVVLYADRKIEATKKVIK